MPVSINGWPVLDNPAWGDPRAKQAPVPGVGTMLWAEEHVWPLFAALVREYHEKINPVHNSDCYDYRSSRTSSAWSNHSSATAVDINADAEGATGSGPLSWWQQGKRAVKAARMKRKYEIVNWGGATICGGDYGAGWWDWMHWELKAGTTVADVQRVIAKLGIQPDGTVSKPKK